MKKTNKLLSVLMALAMVVSMIPTVAMAADSAAEMTGAELLATASEGTVALSGDVKLTESYAVEADMTIDLNGKTLYMATNYNVVCKGATLTIKNGTIDISGVDLTGKTDAGIFAVGGAVTGHATAGHMKLEGVTFTGTDYGTGDNGGVFMLYQGGETYGNSTLLVDDCEMTLTNNASNGTVFYGGGTTCLSTVTVKNSTLTFDDVRRGALYNTMVVEDSTINITGGEHGFNETKLTVIDSDITVSGGIGRALTVNTHGYDVVIQDNSKLSFSDNDEGDIRFKGAANLSVDATSSLAACSIGECVDGATINSKAVWAEATVAVLGGVTTIGNGVAKVDGVQYGTLQAAIDAIETSGTITVLQDIELSEGVTIPAGKTITLDLKGKTISQTKEQTAGYQMLLNDGNLTIKDSAGGGKLSYTDSGTGGEYISDTIYNRGVLVISGGTIENLSSATVASNGYPHAVDSYSGIRDTSVTINGGTIYCAEYSAVRMFCVSATNKADLTIGGSAVIQGAIDMQNGTKVLAIGTLTIDGGTFETTANSNNIRFANWNGGATEYGITAEITGGSFEGGFTTAYVPAAAKFDKGIVSGGQFLSNPAAYLADGYTAVYEDGWYVVSEKTATETEVETTVSSGTSSGENKVVVDTTLSEEEKQKVTQAADEIANNVAGTTSANTQTQEDLGLAADSKENAITNDVIADAMNQTIENESDKITSEEAVEAVVEKLPDAVKTEVESGNTTVTIVVQPSLQITVEDVAVESDAVTSVTVDIQPVYDLVATTQSVAESDAALNDTNSVKLNAKPIPMEVNVPVEISIPLPVGFATGSTVTIVHTKDDGTTYTYTADVVGNVATFTNPNGFSTFTVSTKDQLTAAIEQAQDGAVITLDSNIELSAPLPEITKDITIVGKTSDVTITANMADPANSCDIFNVGANGKLTLGENLKVEANTSVFWAHDGGEIVVDGAVINVTNSPYNAALANASSSITIESGELKATGSDNVTLIAKGQGASVTVNGGTVTSGDSTAVEANDGAVATIAGGTVQTINPSPYSVVVADEGGSAVMTGGTVIVDSNDAFGLSAINSGSITMSGGTVNGGVKAEGVGSEASVLIITGGRVTGKVEARSDDATIEISGGTFSQTPDSAFIKAGYTFENGTVSRIPISVTYRISVADAENGTVKTDKSYSSGSSTVTVTATPDAGYKVAKVTVTLRNGTEIEVTAQSATEYTFRMPRSVAYVSATFECDGSDPDICTSCHLTDVDPNEWYHIAVDYAVKNKLMAGMGGNKFAPGATMERAMVIQVLYNMEGTPAVKYTGKFSDVADGQWYSNAVEWGVANGILADYGTGFNPSGAISREEMVRMMYNYAKYKGLDTSARGDLSKYTDGATTSDWAVEYVEWAVGTGVMVGGGKTLNPTGAASRAEVAQIFKNFHEQYSK